MSDVTDSEERAAIDHPRLVRCPQCEGFGKHASFDGRVERTCDLCEGRGKISDLKVQWRAYGKAMKDHRIQKLQISLREAARRFGCDPSNLSKMERGVIKPSPVYGNLPQNSP